MIKPICEDVEFHRNQANLFVVGAIMACVGVLIIMIAPNLVGGIMGGGIIGISAFALMGVVLEDRKHNKQFSHRFHQA